MHPSAGAKQERQSERQAAAFPISSLTKSSSCTSHTRTDGTWRCCASRWQGTQSGGSSGGRGGGGGWRQRHMARLRGFGVRAPRIRQQQRRRQSGGSRAAASERRRRRRRQVGSKRWLSALLPWLLQPLNSCARAPPRPSAHHGEHANWGLGVLAADQAAECSAEL